MATTSFTTITFNPVTGSTGVAVTHKPVVRIAHLVGGSVPAGYEHAPTLAGLQATAGGPFGGRNWRLRKALDAAGNIAIGEPDITAVTIEYVPSVISPAPSYSEFKFTPTSPLDFAKYYKLEIYGDLEFTAISVGTPD